jgi:hypothetical protein
MSPGPLGRTASLPWTPRRLRAQLPPRLDLLVAVVLATLLEVFGRHSSADWIDAIGALVLADLVHLFLARWPAARWRVRALRRRLGGLWRAVQVPHGLDLREHPPLPGGFPGRPLLALGALGLLFVMVVLAAGSLPTGLRNTLQGFSGLLVLASTGVLWTALGAVALGLWGPLFGVLRARLDPARSQLVGMLLLGGVALVAWRAPARLALALVAALGASCALSLAWLTRDVRLAWRDGRGAVRAGRLGQWEALFLAALLGAALVPVLVATGDRLVGGGHESTAGTALLGRFVLWSLVLGFVPLALERLLPLVRARAADPRIPRAPQVVLSGPAASPECRARLETAGFRCVDASPTGDVRVPLEIVPAAPGDSLGGWRGRATPADLARPSFLARLARRHRVQARRALRRGLVRALARQRAAPRDDGTGTWVAPHLWIAMHLTRDGETTDARPGPAWRWLLPQAARQALAETLQALDIDLLFVEDGVRPRTFARVLDLCFEHHDILGSRRCEDARHFSGLPGVRVLLHEVGLERPIDTGRRAHAEPDTRDLGRARILHVFPDRGGENELADAPSGRDRRPRLVPLGSA